MYNTAVFKCGQKNGLKLSEWKLPKLSLFYPSESNSLLKGALEIRFWGAFLRNYRNKR